MSKEKVPSGSRERLVGNAHEALQVVPPTLLECGGLPYSAHVDRR